MQGVSDINLKLDFGVQRSCIGEKLTLERIWTK